MIRAGLGGSRTRAGIALKSRVDLLKNWELVVPIWRVRWPADVAESIHITNKARSRGGLVIRAGLGGGRTWAEIALKARVNLLKNWELVVPIWRVLWPAEVAGSIHIANKARSRGGLVIRAV
jgi:hypothetical protein